MSNTRTYDKPFEASWAYANLLKSELKAASYDIQPFPGTFKSGRAKWMATFFNGDRKVIARRIGMELTSSKTGDTSKVFSRQEWVDRQGGTVIDTPNTNICYDSGDEFGNVAPR